MEIEGSLRNRPWTVLEKSSGKYYELAWYSTENQALYGARDLCKGLSKPVYIGKKQLFNIKQPYSELTFRKGFNNIRRIEDDHNLKP